MKFQNTVHISFRIKYISVWKDKSHRCFGNIPNMEDIPNIQDWEDERFLFIYNERPGMNLVKVYFWLEIGLYSRTKPLGFFARLPLNILENTFQEWSLSCLLAEFTGLNHSKFSFSIYCVVLLSFIAFVQTGFMAF